MGYLSIECGTVNIFFMICEFVLICHSQFIGTIWKIGMRIYGNRQLKTLPGRNIRPTPARVREALFNIWREEITDCRWLDICAGNGSMGAEALCRGASVAVGLELMGRACAIVRENWQQVRRSPQEFQIVRGDVRQTLKRLAGRQFDRIYFDPPYQSELYDPVLEILSRGELLAESGEMAIEYNPKFWTPNAISPFEIVRQKTYGNTTLAFFRHAEE